MTETNRFISSYNNITSNSFNNLKITNLKFKMDSINKDQ